MVSCEKIQDSGQESEGMRAWEVFVYLVARNGNYNGFPIFKFLFDNFPLQLMDKHLLLILKSRNFVAKESAAQILTMITEVIVPTHPIDEERLCLYEEASIHLLKNWAALSSADDSMLSAVYDCGKMMIIELLKLSLRKDKKWEGFRNLAVDCFYGSGSMEHTRTVLEVVGYLTFSEIESVMADIEMSFQESLCSKLVPLVQEGCIEGFLVIPFITHLLNQTLWLHVMESACSTYITIYGDGLYSNKKTESATALVRSTKDTRHDFSPTLLNNLVAIVSEVDGLEVAIEFGMVLLTRCLESSENNKLSGMEKDDDADETKP